MSDLSSSFRSQIGYSFIFKLLSIFLSFYSVRLQLDFLGVDRFAVWAVIFGVVSWVLLFDFGVSNGIRNKITEALSLGEDVLINEVISTGYFVSFFMVSFFLVSFLIVYFNSDVSALIGVNVEVYGEANIAILVSFIFVCFSLFLGTINQIFHAFKMSNVVVFNQLLSNSLITLSLLVIAPRFEPSVIVLSILFGASITASSITISIYFFGIRRLAVFSFSSIRISKIKGLLVLGVKFFWLQIMILIIFSSDRVVTMHLLETSDVTSYDLLSRYFSPFLIVNALMIAPLWSLYSHASRRADFSWMRSSFFKVHTAFLLYLIGCCFAFFACDFVLGIWVGDVRKNISSENIFLMASLTLVFMIYSVYANISNGLELFRWQLICSSLGAVVNIPISVVLVEHYDFGLNGIMIATIVSMLPFCLLAPIHIYSVLFRADL